MASNKEPPKSTIKRDTLRKIELAVQKQWQDSRVFESNAPRPEEPRKEKFMGTFPFPYMNGRLHLGHSFSLSKIEFAMGYERLKGKNCLFPFGFHVTGMPIKAAADKIKNELYLSDSRISIPSEEEEVVAEAPVANGTEAPSDDPTKFKKKAAKVTAKSTGLKYQFQIMESMGVPREEIYKFADSLHWLYYFPPLAIEDLKAIGLKVDWRRSFMTTEVNPYYDSFVRWQFNRLKAMSPPKVQFGERYTIYSPLDGQPCMDHDRAVGEQKGVQEYTGIKIRIDFEELRSVPDAQRDKLKNGVPVGQVLTSPEVSKAIGSRQVYMVAATLRPETMYGQTNCYVGENIKYGIYEVDDKEAWLMTARAARNMTWQGLFGSKPKGAIVKLAEVIGKDLIGIPINAPLTPYKRIYVLPMEGVLDSKGTGVVTSVPSDSPDDYITLQDLKKKHEWYGVQLKWIEPFPAVPVLETPNYGNLAAKTAIEREKIVSQKDKEKLEKAKADVYKEGFYQGKMVVGAYAGKKVTEAKNLIRQDMIKSGDAIPYCEPEALIVSRSGDECVVSLENQWYIDYGETVWRTQVEDEETKKQFEIILGWLNQWACARSFGLGTKLPWDPQYVIESLSDSTIYMAYYTVSHLLHGGTLDGSKPGPVGIDSKQLTDDVWDYIFRDDAPPPANTTIPSASLDLLRHEFRYWYPMNVRVSGKDLIGNHLTFALYNHVAIFEPKYWPLGMRANGHLLLDGAKMSKSTGNFKTLTESTDEFGADATRFALADAGDGLDDANFMTDTANKAILRLFTQLEWITEVLEDIEQGKLRDTPEMTLLDIAFQSEMDLQIAETAKAYDAMLYREAVKEGFYQLQTARDSYRDATSPGRGIDNHGMHKQLVLRFVEVQALLLAPITPHWSEHVWQNLLKKRELRNWVPQPSSILHALWPETKPIDTVALASVSYLRDIAHNVRASEDQIAKKAAKRGQAVVSGGVKKYRIFWASRFPEYQEQGIALLKETYDAKTQTFSNKEKELAAQRGLNKDKRFIPFLVEFKKRVESTGPSAFNLELAFNEHHVLTSNMEILKRSLNTEHVEIVRKEDVDAASPDMVKAETALPGKPSYTTV
ncbi:leucine---tRNA ligase [Synchytrium microbalum]|uniref:leucine--tRNA ligase n=1 Tax=Synchytrium microbalum TaxID=1806994 RepID=A0A507C211_9FUNG|nr:leucine---tRNA ligase [Synchytrium microbalum]TPX33461.1 leucine---tRNA ligase [Synchytrium microbalum]